MSNPSDSTIGLSRAVAVVGDLLFRSRIREVLGDGVSFVRDSEGLKSAGLVDAQYLFVDLNSLKFPIGELIDAASSVGFLGKTVCFVSHVSEDLIQQANAAGVHEVLPRSKFVVLLEALREQFNKGSLS